MGSKTVTYPVCDSCGKTLMAANDGVVVHGKIYAAGPVTDTATAHKVENEKVVLIGPSGTLRNGAPIESTHCWPCFDKKVKNPQITQLWAKIREAEQRADQAERLSRNQGSQTDYDRRSYDSGGSGGSGQASGPLPPPEMPENATGAEVPVADMVIAAAGRNMNFLLPKNLRRFQ